MIIDKDIVEMMRLYRIKNRLKVCKKHRNVLDQVHHEESCLVAMENYQLLKNKLIGIHGKNNLFNTVKLINKALSTHYTLDELKRIIRDIHNRELKGTQFTVQIGINGEKIGCEYDSYLVSKFPHEKDYFKIWTGQTRGDSFVDIIIRDLTKETMVNLSDDNVINIAITKNEGNVLTNMDLSIKGVRGVLFNVCNAVYAHNPILCTP